MTLDKKKMKKIVTIRDEETWQMEITEKSTLTIYKTFKSSIHEENFYDNSQGLVLLFRCRTNTMPLNNRNRHSNGDTRCPCCGEENEDLEHFLLHCPAYSSYRNSFPLLQQPYLENKCEIIARLLLFFEKSIEIQHDIKKYLCKIFIVRKNLIENS